jgi:hypothetical protein
MNRICSAVIGFIVCAISAAGAGVGAEWPASVPRAAVRHELDAPPGGVLRSVIVQVEVAPGSGGARLYGGPGYDEPVEVPGGASRVEVPTDEPVIYAEPTKGASAVSIHMLGWRDRDR